MSQGQWPLQSSDIELIKNKMLETYEKSNKSFIPCELLESEIKPSYMHKTYFFRILQHLGYKSYRRKWQGKRGVSGYNLEKILTDDEVTSIIDLLSNNTIGNNTKLPDYIAKPHKYQSFQGIVKPTSFDMPKKLSYVFPWQDLHIGGKTRTFNSLIAERRISQTCQRMSKVAIDNNEFDKCDECVIVFAGDIIDGVNVYPGQPFEQEWPKIEDQIDRAPAILNPIFDFAKKFERVRVIYQCGNHGKISKHHGNSNWEQKLAENIKADFGKLLGADVVESISVFEPTIFTVKNTRFLVTHGEEIQGVAGTPFFGMSKRFAAWADHYQFDVGLGGHWHIKLNLPHTKVNEFYFSGTIKNNDLHCIKKYGRDGMMMGWSFLVHPDLPKRIYDNHNVYYGLEDEG